MIWLRAGQSSNPVYERERIHPMKQENRGAIGIARGFIL
jgi:hypothetical protein